MSDDELMILIQSGASGAFEMLVLRYQAMLIGFFIRSTRDPQLAEDLAQETLLKVHQQSWDYLPLGRFRGWLFRIARNLLIDDVRRRSHDALLPAMKRRTGEEDQVLPQVAGKFLPVGRRLEQQEFEDILQEMLLEIPQDQREVFAWYYAALIEELKQDPSAAGSPQFDLLEFEDRTLTDIAETMDISVATCKSRLRLAREKLAEKLRARGISPAAEND